MRIFFQKHVFTSWWKEQHCYGGEGTQEKGQGIGSGMKQFSVRLIYHLLTGNFEARLGSAHEEAVSKVKTRSPAHREASLGGNQRADAIYIIPSSILIT